MQHLIEKYYSIPSAAHCQEGGFQRYINHQESTCGCVGAWYKHLCAHVSVSAYMPTAENVRWCVRVKEPRGKMGRMKHFCYRR